MRRLILWLAAIAVMGTGCLDPRLVFTCRTSEQCGGVQGVPGVCETSGFCSFVDSTCKSGRRYGRYVEEQRSDQCTECGNGLVDVGEQCDDGNSLTSDACLPSCRWNVCGDGFKRDVVEACDDSNRTNGDGCTETCLQCGAGDARYFWPENGHCYARFDAPRSWANAQKACAETGGHLATYNSYVEQMMVRPALLTDVTSAAWIGLHDVNGAAMYRWVTNEPVIVPMPGFAAPFPMGMCAANRGAAGTWSYLPCSSANPSICEDPGWTIDPQRRHAYRAFFSQPSWMAAMETCQLWGGHLLTIGDVGEQEFISGQFFGTFWLGAMKTAAPADRYAWITAEPFAYTNFAAGEPDDAVLPACVALGDDHRWHDRNCDGSFRGPYDFICEVE